MMLVGLAQHNQPQRQSEPDLGPIITSLAANKLLPPARSTACPITLVRLSVSACDDSLPPPLRHHHHLRSPPPGISASALASS
jgi:hypothetical protein